MKTILSLALILACSQAWSFENREYRCKNGNPNLQDNIYQISASDIGGANLPYVHITRHYLDTAGESIEVNIRGIATVATRGNVETLSLNQINLEFIDGKLTGCRTNEEDEPSSL